MKCGVLSVKSGVWSVKCGVGSVECEVWSGKCEVWSVESGVRSSSGKCLEQTLQYKVVLGIAWCKLL